MEDDVQRSAMTIRLSASEHAQLERRAKRLGMSKAALIRQMIREDSAKTETKPFDAAEFLSDFRRVFAGKIKRI